MGGFEEGGSARWIRLRGIKWEDVTLIYRCVDVDDGKVCIRTMIDMHTKHGRDQKRCAMCMDAIRDGDEIALIITTDAGFPNVYVRSRYVDRHNDEQIANLARLLKSRYQEYLDGWRERDVWGDR